MMRLRINDERAAELARLGCEATDAPWEAVNGVTIGAVVGPDRTLVAQVLLKKLLITETRDYTRAIARADADAACTAAARNALPDLLADRALLLNVVRELADALTAPSYFNANDKARADAALARVAALGIGEVRTKGSR